MWLKYLQNANISSSNSDKDKNKVSLDYEDKLSWN